MSLKFIKKLLIIIAFLGQGFIMIVKAQARPLTIRDKKVINLVNSILEVSESNRYIQKVTKGARKLTTEIEFFPTAKEPQYRLTVNEFNGFNAVSHFRFFVNAKTYAVKYWDAANDKAIPLKQWQQHLHKKKRLHK